MKRMTVVITLTISSALCNPANSAIVYDDGTQILSDTQGARMWLLHGIGFASSYPYPEFANTWIAGLNQQEYGGYDDWRLPTVQSGDPTPPAMSGDLGELFINLSAAYSNRDEWPWGLGNFEYGGFVIFSDLYADGGRYWGMSFGDGGYQSLYCGFAYAWVGTMAVRSVLVPGLPGDFDLDEDVDGADFLLWQRGGSPYRLSAPDLIDWQNNFGAPPSLVRSNQAPEPTALMLVAIAAGAIWFRQRHWR
jgi:hypothetical protein